MEKGDGGGRFSAVLSILITVLALVSALVAWRASVAADTAGDANGTGLSVALNAEEANALSQARLYEHYRAYFNYVRHATLGRALDRDAAATSFEGEMRPEGSTAEASYVADVLSGLRDTAFDMAGASQYFFVTNYLRSDGTYDTERELGETLAEAGRRRDLDPLPHFARADLYRAKSNGLVATLIVLAAGLWFFTVAQGIVGRTKYLLAAAGVILLLAGSAAAAALEFLLRV